MFNSFISNAIVMQLAATIILVLFIKKWTYSAYVEYMDKRKENINGNILEAQNKQEQAAEILRELTKEKEDLKIKKQKILAEAEAQAKVRKEEIIEESKRTARLNLDKATREIENDRIQVQKELSSEVMELVGLVSEKFLSEAMKEQDNSVMIKAALEKVQLERA